MWHIEPLETTICYLTLPKQMSSKRTYALNEFEAESGITVIDGAQSCFVQLAGTEERDKRMRQFRRVLRELRLEPYIHPSQLNETISDRPMQKKPALANVDEAGVDAEMTKGRGKIYIMQLMWFGADGLQIRSRSNGLS